MEQDIQEVFDKLQNYYRKLEDAGIAIDHAFDFYNEHWIIKFNDGSSKTYTDGNIDSMNDVIWGLEDKYKDIVTKGDNVNNPNIIINQDFSKLISKNLAEELLNNESLSEQQIKEIITDSLTNSIGLENIKAACMEPNIDLNNFKLTKNELDNLKQYDNVTRIAIFDKDPETEETNITYQLIGYNSPTKELELTPNNNPESETIKENENMSDLQKMLEELIKKTDESIARISMAKNLDDNVKEYTIKTYEEDKAKYEKMLEIEKKGLSVDTLYNSKDAETQEMAEDLDIAFKKGDDALKQNLSNQMELMDLNNDFVNQAENDFTAEGKLNMDDLTAQKFIAEHPIGYAMFKTKEDFQNHFKTILSDIADAKSALNDANIKYSTFKDKVVTNSLNVIALPYNKLIAPIKMATTEAIKNAATQLSNALDEISNDFKNFVQDCKDKVSGIKTAIATKVGNVVDTVKNLGDKVAVGACHFEGKTLAKVGTLTKKMQDRADNRLAKYSEIDKNLSEISNDIGQKINSLISPTPYKKKEYEPSPELKNEIERLKALETPTTAQKYMLKKMENYAKKEGFMHNAYEFIKADLIQTKNDINKLKLPYFMLDKKLIDVQEFVMNKEVSKACKQVQKLDTFNKNLDQKVGDLLGKQTKASQVPPTQYGQGQDDIERD